MEWYLKALKQYKDFDTRAGRKEYWMFYLFNVIFAIATGIVDRMLGNFGVIGYLYSIVLILPSLAASVRRLHDIGKSGWWLLVGFIPIIGWIWLIILLAKEGMSGDNQYGPKPNELAA